MFRKTLFLSKHKYFPNYDKEVPQRARWVFQK